MKKNGKDRMKYVLYACILLIGLYITATFIFYLRVKLGFDILLMFAPQISFIYIVKWIFAAAMMYSLIKINRNPNRYWLVLNISAASFVIWNTWELANYMYYRPGYLDMSFGALAVLLIIITNMKYFVSRYNITKRRRYWPYLVFMPVLLSFIVGFTMIIFLKNGWYY